MVMVSHSQSRSIDALPGVTRRTLSEAAGLMLVEFSFALGATVLQHTHPNAQAGYIVSGRMVMQVGGEERELGPGDSYAIPPMVPHGARATQPSVVVDCFHPPREDYR